MPVHAPKGYASCSQCHAFIKRKDIIFTSVQHSHQTRICLECWKKRRLDNKSISNRAFRRTINHSSFSIREHNRYKGKRVDGI
jgi:hypothetical protein